MYKKITGLILTLAMLFSMCTPVFASDLTTPPLFAMDRETTDLETYQIAMAEDNESQRNDIHAEIEAYQTATPSLCAYNGGFNYLTGDIIVTSSASGNGILGHAGIVVTSTAFVCMILEIKSNLYNDVNKKTIAVPIST